MSIESGKPFSGCSAGTLFATPVTAPADGSRNLLNPGRQRSVQLRHGTRARSPTPDYRPRDARPPIRQILRVDWRLLRSQKCAPQKARTGVRLTCSSWGILPVFSAARRLCSVWDTGVAAWVENCSREAVCRVSTHLSPRSPVQVLL